MIPSAHITTPAMRFMVSICRGRKPRRKRLIIEVSAIHQSIAPSRKPPSTKMLFIIGCIVCATSADSSASNARSMLNIVKKAKM